MATGGHRVRLENSRFLEELGGRTGIWWDLVAAAAGEDGAVRRVRHCLSTAELDLGAHGKSMMPPIVEECVEAIAACDSALLNDLAATWRAPADADASPFWSTAWRSALRHLAAPLGLERAVRDTRELAAEASLVWDPPPLEAHSWDDLIRECTSGFPSFERIRRLAKQPLTDASIGARQIEAAPLLMLRVLRGRTALLDAGARDRLRAVARGAASLDPFEGALVVETVATFDPDINGIVRSDVGARLSGITDARLVIPLIYVLMETGWVVA